MVQTPTQLWSTETTYNADVVSWCPFNSSLFVCGTYQLMEDTGNRVGSLEVYQTDGVTCKSIQTEIGPGVLDVRWLDHSGWFLAAALADGNLGLWKMSDEGQLNLCKTFSSSFQNSIAMSLDICHLDTRCAATCDAKGYLTVHDLSHEVYNSQQWKGHDFECWAVAFDNQNSNIVYSGGDDCLLKMWDLRGNLKKPTLRCDSHSMGVTCIAPAPISYQEHKLATGSYDEKIFIWDDRKFSQPVKSCEVGGGVWRLKWHPSLGKLLSACMHAGFLVLNEDTSVMAEYKIHGSLAYGVDWGSMHTQDNEATQLVASCSFYDKSLQLWKLKYNH